MFFFFVTNELLHIFSTKNKVFVRLRTINHGKSRLYENRNYCFVLHIKFCFRNLLFVLHVHIIFNLFLCLVKYLFIEAKSWTNWIAVAVWGENVVSFFMEPSLNLYLLKNYTESAVLLLFYYLIHFIMYIHKEYKILKHKIFSVLFCFTYVLLQWGWFSFLFVH